MKSYTIVSLDFVDENGERTTCCELIQGNKAVAIVNFKDDKINWESFAPSVSSRNLAIRRLLRIMRGKSMPLVFSRSH
jgi:hypothetical protein